MASTIATDSWRRGRPVAAQPGGDTSDAYDFQNQLTGLARTAGPQERLVYGPTGELLYRQVDERFAFLAGQCLAAGPRRSWSTMPTARS